MTELSSIQEKLQIVKGKYEILPPVRMRRLTIPAIFQRKYDENFISDYLKYILDPKVNGIGVEPLQAFLNLAFTEIEISSDVISITREYTFHDSQYGRIDLLIKIGENVVIGVENKILSEEGENQTRFYEKVMEDDFEVYQRYMIYLTPRGQQARSQNFRPISYLDLFDSFRTISYPFLPDIHKSVIWEDFLCHLEEYIIMAKNKIEISKQTLLYLEYRDMIEDLKKAFDQDIQKLYDIAMESIFNRFTEGWQSYSRTSDYWHWFVKDNWHLKDCYVFYLFAFWRKELLISGKFSYMLGVYPNKGDGPQFIAFLKSNYPQIEHLCTERNIIPYSQLRSAGLLIAIKDYPLTYDDLDNFSTHFTSAIDEFSVFTPLIDQAVREFKKIQP